MILLGIFVIYLIIFVFICILQIIGLIYALASFVNKKPKLLPLSSNPKVAVVIVCRNEKNIIFKTLKYLFNLGYKNKEIIIGDDSNDGTYEKILKRFNLNPQILRTTENDGNIYIAKNKNLIVIHRDKNYKYKSGSLELVHNYIKNKGIEYYAVFDADWIPQSNFIEKILPYFYTFKDAGCVQFKRVLPKKVSSFFSRITSMSVEAAYLVDLPGRENLRTFILFTGGSAMFRTLAVTNSGGWYAKTQTEDIELSIRLYNQGYKIYFSKEAESYGEETPNKFSDFVVQQSGWQRGTIDIIKNDLLNSLISNKLTINEKIGLIYQSFTYIPYFFILLFILFNILVDCLLFFGMLPYTLYIPLGMLGHYFYWIALLVFIVDTLKVGISSLRSNSKFNIFLIPFTTLSYWSLILFGFIANLKGLIGVKWERVVTPKLKVKNTNIHRFKIYKIVYLLLFILVSLMYFYELFILNYTISFYHVFLPLSLLWGFILLK